MSLRPARFVLRALAVAIAAVATFAVTASSGAQTVPVYVFPIPGGHFAAPTTQITFRGLPVAQLGSVTVTGSRSGVHTGTIRGDSDSDGASFFPAKPFTPGETVTVKTSLDVVGGSGGSYQFTVAAPAGAIPFRPRPAAPRVPGDVNRFVSRPDLVPAAVKILKNSRSAAPGDLFLGPQIGPVQDGPQIRDPAGNLVWFKPLGKNDWISDFRVQTYGGQPALTWWQGFVDAGVGFGEGVIDNSSYNQIATVHAGNGLRADLHEFQLTPQGTALVTAYYPVFADLRSVHGPRKGVALDAVVQEIDIPTGLVLYQWDSLDHVSLTDSYEPMPGPKSPFDYFHINSIQQDTDGNVVVSARNTWAGYKLDHKTGQVIWILGGKRSSFKMKPGAQFVFQHDIRVRSPHVVTIFDDGAGPPVVHSQSRGLTLVLDFVHRTATRVATYLHTPSLLSAFEGNMQLLPGGDDFVGWGQNPFFTEFDSRGKIVYDGRFVDNNSHYRAYRFPWNGTPQSLPAVAAVNRGKKTNVYASWNGATNVGFWRVLGGASPTTLTPVATARTHGFETAIGITAANYVLVQALDASGHVLQQSGVVRSR